ncbi:RNA 2',3'-cyclic phosphodiesterase [uncultured Dysosmobacter sp.]|uniref:RNA 2',3'-cyclic phosphodiesterase n=1 Tax=uncultured Dysosmobacter sp. TaxID=2591384 RepID=UPI0026274BA9|nr:RNA 2',3'-cyclic phosphodiesterase [uncultured Dysosmobacter sp.]
MRLFAAIRFSPAVRASLLEAAAALQRQGAGRFTRPENFHLTLAFIGETEKLAEAKAALEAACTGGPVSLTVGGLGHFGDLWWTGIRENPRLAALALGVQQALRDQGFSVEKRPWKPHVTLVRQWRGPCPRLTVREVSMRAERVSLMKSERIHGKLTYTEIYSVRL